MLFTIFQNAYKGNTKFQTGRANKYTSIQNTYTARCAVRTINKAGKPRMAANNANGIMGGLAETKESTIMYIVNEIAAGNTTVPTSSMKITNYNKKLSIPNERKY